MIMYIRVEVICICPQIAFGLTYDLKKKSVNVMNLFKIFQIIFKLILENRKTVKRKTVII